MIRDKLIFSDYIILSTRTSDLRLLFIGILFSQKSIKTTKVYYQIELMISQKTKVLIINSQNSIFCFLLRTNL